MWYNDSEQFCNLVSGRSRDSGAVLLRTLLGLAEYPYRSVVEIRNFLYDTGRLKTHRIPLPIISVGNPTLGGTGKSPLVAWLGCLFIERGLQIGLISRGYGRSKRSLETKVNDEFLELAFRLPMVPHRQNPDRVAAAWEFWNQRETELVDLLILDDAMQHRRIGRDLDIALLDATEPFGHEHVFPRGTLREPLHCLRRSDVVLLSRADLVSEQERNRIRDRVLGIAPKVVWGEMAHVPDHLLDLDHRESDLKELRGKKAYIFCGIGNPSAFRDTLTRCGVQVVGQMSFPDHWSYSESDLLRLEKDALHHEAEMLLCTMKDLVKIDPHVPRKLPIRALTIKIEFLRGEDAFREICLDKINGFIDKRKGVSDVLRQNLFSF